MSKSRKDLLKRIVSINEDCSNTSSEENEIELCQRENEIEISESVESEEIEESSYSEEENFQNMCHNRKRMHILSDSESENETNIPRTSQHVTSETEIEVDGTLWNKLEISRSSE